ncbi:hypothetical protein [Pseudomonas shirazensis]|uniref:hypothetical protein n=1 Tax=Pseudomonas shirazensis TaxID=2745494 RepID=UPI003D28D98C
MLPIERGHKLLTLNLEEITVLVNLNAHNQGSEIRAKTNLHTPSYESRVLQPLVAAIKRPNKWLYYCRITEMAIDLICDMADQIRYLPLRILINHDCSLR